MCDLKLPIFCLCFLFSWVNLHAQFKKIDNAILSIPKQDERSIESVIKYIEANAASNLEKARGAFCWIANHVSYDIRKYSHDKPSNFEPQKVFRKRKAVCAGYSNLYMDMCKQMQLPCEMVSGYSKGFAYKKGQVLNESDHVWNAVKVDTAWRLIDVTWGAGYIKKIAFLKVFKKKYNDKYFNTKPEEFLLNHLPEVPMWQLQEHPVSLRAFSADDSKIYDELKKQKSAYFKFSDSIDVFRNKDSGAMALDFGKMAIRFNSHNPIPLAFGMLKNVEDNIHKKIYSSESNIIVIDSMIYFTNNSIKLFKKAKSSSKAVKEHLEENINMANRILAQLHSIRSTYYENKLLEQTSFTYDSLKFVSDQIHKSLLTVITIYKHEHLRRLLKDSEDRFCNIHLNLYNNFSELQTKESEKKNQKLIHKQMLFLVNSVKKNVTHQSDCLKTINSLRT